MASSSSRVSMASSCRRREARACPGCNIFTAPSQRHPPFPSRSTRGRAARLLERAGVDQPATSPGGAYSSSCASFAPRTSCSVSGSAFGSSREKASCSTRSGSGCPVSLPYSALAARANVAGSCFQRAVRARWARRRATTACRRPSSARRLATITVVGNFRSGHSRARRRGCARLPRPRAALPMARDPGRGELAAREEPHDVGVGERHDATSSARSPIRSPCLRNQTRRAMSWVLPSCGEATRFPRRSREERAPRA